MWTKQVNRQRFIQVVGKTEKKIPADPESLFKIASISKLYDAVAVTKLVSDGRLSLDKTIVDYLPELVG